MAYFPLDILKLIFDYPITWPYLTDFKKVCRDWKHAVDYCVQNNKISLIVCLMEGYTCHFIQHYLYVLSKDDLMKCKVIANFKRNRELSILLRKFKSGYNADSVVDWFCATDNLGYFEFIVKHNSKVNYGYHIDELIKNDCHNIICYIVQNKKICHHLHTYDIDKIMEYAYLHRYKDLLHLLKESISDFGEGYVREMMQHSMQAIDLLNTVIDYDVESFKNILHHAKIPSCYITLAFKVIVQEQCLEFID